MAKKISAWAMFLRAFILTLFTGSTLTSGQAQGNNDDNAWNYAVSIGTASAMREYLRAFPTGAHIEEAIRVLLAMGELGAGTSPFVHPLGGLTGPKSSPGLPATNPY